MTSTLIANVTVHDGRPESTPSVGNVVIADGRIKSVGAGAASAQTVVDATGEHLVPGLIDCHVHLFMNAEPTAIEDFMQADDTAKLGWARANCESLVRSGVTTIREIAAPNALMAQLLQDINAQNLPAPRVLPAFSNITTSGGHGYFLGVEAESIDELRQAARDQIQSGARFVKIMASGGVMTPTSDPTSSQYSSDQLRAVVEEAAAAGVPCAAHAHSIEAVRNSIEAGITSIEHGHLPRRPHGRAYGRRRRLARANGCNALLRGEKHRPSGASGLGARKSRGSQTGLLQARRRRPCGGSKDRGRFRHGNTVRRAHE